MGRKTRHSIDTRDADVLLDTLREAREARGISQREVARRLEMHPTTYGKIEQGNRLLDVVEFVAVAGALGMDPITLLGDYLVRLQQDRVASQSKPMEQDR